LYRDQRKPSARPHERLGAFLILLDTREIRDILLELFYLENKINRLCQKFYEKQDRKMKKQIRRDRENFSDQQVVQGYFQQQ